MKCPPRRIVACPKSLSVAIRSAGAGRILTTEVESRHLDTSARGAPGFSFAGRGRT